MNKKHKVITFGEVMLRLSTPGYQRFGQATQLDATFGGGEANVAVSLANYGVDAEFVTALPSNDIADSCIAELRGFGVGVNHIVRSGSRMGIYFLETGAVNRPSKVIYDRTGSSISELQPGTICWDEVFADATWFHWTGITPAISDSAAKLCKEALVAAERLGITISCDLNYRKNRWKYGKTASEVMPDLVAHCDVILGNEEDAEKVFGIMPQVVHNQEISESYRSVCAQLMEGFPKASRVVISLRGSINANHNSWSGVLYDGQQLYVAPIYQITHIVDRVGGGDSFMGGLIYGLITYTDSLQKALDFAVAASCLKHTITGDYNRVSVTEVEQLMGGNTSGRVQR